MFCRLQDLNPPGGHFRVRLLSERSRPGAGRHLRAVASTLKRVYAVSRLTSDVVILGYMLGVGLVMVAGLK